MGGGGKIGNKVAARYAPTSFGNGLSEYNEDPDCTLKLFRNRRRNGCDPMVELFLFLKEYDEGTKETTLVLSLWLSGVFDQLNSPSFSCLEAHESGACGKTEMASVK